MTRAFVLTAGASLGAAQVGMLQALAEHGIWPDFVLGSSVGALNAAWIAAHPEPRQLDGLARLWRGLKKEHFFPRRRLTGAFNLRGRSDHLVSPDGLRAVIENHLPIRRLEEASIPLYVVATDLFSGREVVLSRGDAVNALLASAAIPGIYPPVRVAGRELIDGSVANHAPVSQAVALGADSVYVLPTGHASTLPESPRSALGIALHALSMLVQQRLYADIEAIGLLEDQVELRVLLPRRPPAVWPADFGHADELIRQSRESTAAFLAEPRWRPAPPPAGSDGGAPPQGREFSRHPARRS